MRTRAKVDVNQKAIVLVLREVGATVQHLHTVGKGCIDLLVGYRQVNHVLEVKMPGEKLTPDEETWHANWQGTAHVVTTPSEALRAIGAIGHETRGG